MVGLDFYLGRRRMTIEQYCTANKILSYTELCENLRAVGVAYPNESAVSHVFVLPEPPAVDEVAPPTPEPVVSKPTKRKEDV